MPRPDDDGWQGYFSADDVTRTLRPGLRRAFNPALSADPSERCAHHVNQLFPGILPDEWITETYGD